MKSFRIILTSSALLIILFALFIFQNRSFAPVRSDASSSDITVEKDISYGKHPKQNLDLCKPLNLQGQAPAVILIHGGGGDKSQHLSECKALAQEGLVAIAVNFREEPPPSWKVILTDNALALDWLKSRDYVDRKYIGAMGGSLGGYVSSMSGTYESSEKVSCVVNNFGPTDFTDENFEGTPLVDEFVNKFFGGVTYEENPQLYERLSPITRVSVEDAKSWLFTRSTEDTLIPRSQMTKMINKLNSVGIETELYEYNGSGGGHANKLPAWKRFLLFRKRINFLTDCLSY